jgi:hydroxylysine kinase
MPATDPLAVLAEDAPEFTDEDAIKLLREHWGLTATVKPLVSERDQNFRATAAEGQRYVLKIANAAESPQVTDFQIEALIHIERQKRALGITLGTPEVRRTLAGETSIRIESPAGRHVTRLVTFLSGEPLAERLPSRSLARNLGCALADLGRALAGFEHEGSQQSLLWDMQNALTLRELIPCIEGAEVAAAVGAALDDFERYAAPVLSGLRAQVIHSDLNPDNVVIDEADDDRVVGVIDFGDMVYAPLIVDVAIGCSYLRVPDGDPLALIRELLAGYHAVTPLLPEEFELLFELIQARLCASIAILDWRASQRGDDDLYLASRVLAGEGSPQHFLRRLRDVPRDQAIAVFEEVCAPAD